MADGQYNLYVFISNGFNSTLKCLSFTSQTYFSSHSIILVSTSLFTGVLNFSTAEEYPDNFIYTTNADAIGKGLAAFDKMSLEEQKAFYLKNAPLLANFQYDIDDAYAAFCKAKLMGAE